MLYNPDCFAFYFLKSYMSFSYCVLLYRIEIIQQIIITSFDQKWGYEKYEKNNSFKQTGIHFCCSCGAAPVCSSPFRRG